MRLKCGLTKWTVLTMAVRYLADSKQDFLMKSELIRGSRLCC